MARLPPLLKKLILPGCLLVLAAFLFFPELGQTPLKSWDEAWYAEISRNILKNNQWFLLQWNSQPYYDHPPLGFWLISLSFKIFGVNELAARLPSALAGIGSVLLIYFIGKRLFNQYVSFAAGIALATTPWFWLRSREGNLDIFLIFSMLLSLWLILKAKKNPKILPFVGAAVALTLLAKTIIGVAFLPVLAYCYLEPKKSKINHLAKAAAISLLVFLPWYLINFGAYGLEFIDRNIFIIGLRMVSYKAIGSASGSFGLYPKENLHNLHMGILLWYKPFLISFLGSLLFLRNKSFRILILWLLIYLGLFFTSSKTQLWHLMVVYPAVVSIIPAFIYYSGETLINFLGKTKKEFKAISFAPALLAIGFSVFTGTRVVRGLYKDIVKSQPVNDEVILSQELGLQKGHAYIDDDYWPAAIFYSQKNIIAIPFNPDRESRSLPAVFTRSGRPFFVLTKIWLLDREGIASKDYEVIKQVGERVLVKSKD